MKKKIFSRCSFRLGRSFHGRPGPAGSVAQGERLYINREDPAIAKQALDKYLGVLKINADSYEALWRAGKVIYTIGMAARSDEEKKTIFNDGIHYCKKAVAVNPNGVEGHYWLGVNSGSYGEARGVFKSLFLKNDIIRAMNTVISSTKRTRGGAYRVLGRVYFKVPGLFGGSNQKSKTYSRRAAKSARPTP